jgi:hypothetical protein
MSHLSQLMESQFRASIPGNRAKWIALLVATVTVSLGPKAVAAMPARTQSASRASGLAVGIPCCRTTAQNIAALSMPKC